jgi:hypothetical protein
MKTKIFLFLLLLSISGNSYSQFFSRFGINFTGVSTDIETKIKSPYSTFHYDSTRFFNYSSIDVSLFAEWLNYKHFCLLTELHYVSKGETGSVSYMTPKIIVPPIGDPHFETGNITHKINYLSLQFLPKIRISFLFTENTMFIYGGASLNYRLTNDIKCDEPAYIKERNNFDFDGVIGWGFEIRRTVSLEIKYERSFTAPYVFEHDYSRVTRHFHSLSIIAGWILMKRDKPL